MSQTVSSGTSKENMIKLRTFSHVVLEKVPSLWKTDVVYVRLFCIPAKRLKAKCLNTKSLNTAINVSAFLFSSFAGRIDCPPQIYSTHFVEEFKVCSL